MKIRYVSCTSGAALEQQPKSKPNPLLAVQREKSGASTFGKYDYQYHWALCRVLKEHDSEGDYIIIIEHHEDVVIADSIDDSIAQFEFNQVKDLSGSPYTHQKLIKRIKKGDKFENSILGKMMLSVEGKPFKDKIKALNLVATCGFDMPLNIKGLDLEVITYGDIKPDCLSEIQAALEHEVGLDKLPSTLTFITPDLPSKGVEDSTVGKITHLIDKMTPGSKCNAQNIYRTLIDDLHRKGKLTYDYTDWNAYIKNKGLTKSDVGKSIAAYTDTLGLEELMPDFEDISDQLGLKFPKSSEVKKAFTRYHNTKRFDRSLFSLDIQATIQGKVIEHFSKLHSEGIVKYIETVMVSLPADVAGKLIEPGAIQAAVIYELIAKTYE